MIGRKAITLAFAMATLSLGAPPESPSPFVLCVTSPAIPRDASSVPSVAIGRAFYRRLDARQRVELRAALEESVTRREARVNPLGIDLEDGDPDARLDKLAHELPVTFGVARALAAPRYCGNDGFCVRVTAKSCLPGEHAAEGDEKSRATTLAWPYAHARIETGDVAHHDSDPSVGLVLESDETAPDADEDKALTLMVRREQLAAIEQGDTEDTGPGDPVWAPKPHERLVVPTLYAVGAQITAQK